MTEIDYDKMSDRELDSAVATEVMQQVSCSSWKRINLGSGGGPAMMKDPECGHGTAENGVGKCFPIDTGYPGSGPARYSTNDNAVRSVRNRIEYLGLEDEYLIHLRRLIQSGSEWAEIQSTPRQQCIAALQAVKGKG